MTEELSPLEKRRKRLIFRAWHRGTKEADLIFGHFMDLNAARLSDDEMEWFEALFAERELDILDWIYGRAPTPEVYDTDLFRQVRKLDFIPPVKP